MAIYGTDGSDLINPRGGETVYGLGGDDHIRADDHAAYAFYGGEGNDRLWGGAGNDILDGGPGADYMDGYLGADTFFVDDPGDVVVTRDADFPNVDTVVASISHSLGRGLGNLTLVGSSEIDGTGNDLSNLLIGNDAHNHLYGGGGADILDGGPGADSMAGGDGDDDYYVDHPNDLVWETTSAAEGGADDVASTISITLGLGVERLFLSGGADIDATGNDLDNYLGGNAGRNVLTGGAGNDRLYGDKGADTLKSGKGEDFLFSSKGKDRMTGGDGHDEFVFLARKEGADRITDFRGEDVIGIYAKGFGAGLRTGRYLDESQFQASSGNRAQDSDVRFVFRTTDESLWFDRNGDRAGGLELIADLQNNARLTEDDIWLG